MPHRSRSGTPPIETAKTLLELLQDQAREAQPGRPHRRLLRDREVEAAGGAADSWTGSIQVDVDAVSDGGALI